MKVFISSVIGGFESYREAAASAVETLDCEVVRAEDFGATASSPQEACLAGVREADLTILFATGLPRLLEDRLEPGALLSGSYLQRDTSP